MAHYDHRSIEPKWQKWWEDQGLNLARVDPSTPKHYALTMFPYPSGDLHIGHWYAIAPSDAMARFRRMQGYNVFFPMGFDAFGLPAENAAIKHGIHPRDWTMSNIERMQQQLRSMGGMFDWTREVITCLPQYYRWNQWFFLKMYEKGLAYKRHSPVDWCPECTTTIAREQVVGEERVCERCGTPVIKKALDQWYLRITAYADELLDFSQLDWPQRVKAMQENWIGRSEGVEFDLPVEGSESAFPVFTTRIDTVYGVSFAVLAPEHPLVEEVTEPEYRDEVRSYVDRSVRRTEMDRLSTAQERDGVFTGAYAVNPLSGDRIPIFVADYVLMTYGTGAIMGVPAHDERDFDFAVKYDLPIPEVIDPTGDNGGKPLEEAYVGEGTMINSGPYTGLSSEEGRDRIAEDMQKNGLGQRKINYRLRDWLISRQRYWGTPIPAVYCSECGIVPVPEDQLPVLLPLEAEFKPTGESPLKSHEEFVNTTCPACGDPAQRETDTMDTFFDSSWYQYRYLSPEYEDGPFDPEEGAYWLPVDQYTGGVEHSTMHLLYTRFFTKVMRDLGLVDFDEPMLKLFNQGVILGEDSEKMSKSRGNVVSPDALVEQYGADVVRTYLMFMAPWDQGGPWSHAGIEGSVRFLNRLWRLAHPSWRETSGSDPDGGDLTEEDLYRSLHRTISRVTRDFESFKFNTAIASLMEFINLLTPAQEGPLAQRELWRQSVDTLILLVAPIAPHLAEELWQVRGRGGSVHQQEWPRYDESALAEETITLVVQVNGRVRGNVEVERGAEQDQVEKLASSNERVASFLEGKEVVKVILVPDRLINFVVK